MERYTARNGNGDAYIVVKGDWTSDEQVNYTQSAVNKFAEYEDLESKIGIPLSALAELCDKCIPDECKNPSKAIMLTDEDVDRWNEYKELEERGLMLKLPCKIGDTVWYVDDDDDNYPLELLIIRIEIRETFIHYIAREKEDCGTLGFVEDDYGETIFLTKEEAEQALQKMKEGV